MANKTKELTPQQITDLVLSQNLIVKINIFKDLKENLDTETNAREEDLKKLKELGK